MADEQELRRLNDELVRGLRGLLSGEIKPDPNLPCRSCSKEGLENPIYDRDLGGPYCSSRCLSAAGARAVYEDLGLGAGFDP